MDHVYKMVELVGSSTTGTEDAIGNAVAKAGQSLRIRWFQVIETRGDVEGNQIAHWQVTIKVSFKMEENP